MEDLRHEHTAAPLVESALDPDPLVQFDRWFTDARARGVREPDAMTLATASPAGVPSARTVALRGWGPAGLVFFTSYESAKAADLARNPIAAVVFHWREVSRQVRFVGAVDVLEADASDRYYASRPLGSRLGAWASPQHGVLTSRAALDAAVEEAAARFGEDPPRPPRWGGYRVRPHEVELWQGQPDRLHDRIRYRRTDEGWERERLWP